MNCEGYLIPDSHSSRFLILPQNCLEWECLPVQDFSAYFGLSTAPEIFIKIFAVVSEWAHERGILFLSYLSNWLIIAESVPCLVKYWEFLLCLCQNLGIVINVEVSNLKPTNRAQYLMMLVDTIQERSI